MANNDIIAVPPRNSMNTGLTTPSETFMLQLFGPPGTTKPDDCDDDDAVITNRFKAHVITSDVGPFKVTGFKLAVESLETILNDVHVNHPSLLSNLKTDGMLCIRKRRTSSKWSNHAFGCAVDLRYPTTVQPYRKGIPQGDPHTFQGLSDLYFYFHARKWFWGAGYSGGSVDAMHFEPSVELLSEWSQKFGPF